MGEYAKGTAVTEDQSQIEIKRTIARYGGDLPSFSWGKDQYTAVVAFRHSGRYIRLDVPLPRSGELPTGRHPERVVMEAETRRRWRVALLRLKTRFEEMEEGVSVDEAFMPYLMLPEGGTVRDRMLPLIEDAYLTGRTPSLMLGSGT